MPQKEVKKKDIKDKRPVVNLYIPKHVIDAFDVEAASVLIKTGQKKSRKDLMEEILIKEGERLLKK